MRKIFTPEVVFLLAALVLTFIALAITEPALNTGDYYRVLGSMSLNVPDMTAPGDCIPYINPDPWADLKPTLAVFGILFNLGNRAFGNDCLNMNHWFLFLSGIYWLGAFFAIRGTRGPNLVVRGLLLLSFFFVFSGFLKSFFEETALIAMTPWLALLAGQRNPHVALFIPVAFLALMSKSQAIFFAPVLLFIVVRMYVATRAWLPALLAAGAVLLGCYLALSYSYLIGNDPYNSYNRIYNGIGWVRLDVEDWPAIHYGERHAHFLENQTAFTKTTASICAPEGVNLMGTGYWPTGYDLQHDPAPIDGEYDTADFLGALGFDDFFACFAEQTSVWEYLGAIYPIFVRSDYSIETIILHSGDGWFLGGMEALRQLILRNLSKILGATLMLLGLVYRGPGRSAVAAYAVLAAPVFVVVGDGFFEFERHMIINFAFLICPAFLFLSDDRNPPLAPPGPPETSRD